MSPRILIVMGDTKMTGPVKGILQMLTLLRVMKTGHYSLANCLVTGADATELSNEFIANGFEIIELRHGGRDYKGLLNQAKSLVESTGINIVQTHGYKQSLIGLCLKFKLGVKWICFMHGTTNETLAAKLYHQFDNLMQRFADRTVLITNAQRKKIIHGSDSKRVRVIHNSVDINNPARGSLNRKNIKRLLAIENRFLFTVVGRLSSEKGVDVFLKAFALLINQRPQSQAIIVGDGTERENLISLQKHLGLDNCVKFVGYSPTPRDFIEATDVVVLPSRSEGISNIALESMALKKPVIATAVGGTPEIIEPNISGILACKDSPEQLAVEMMRLIDNPLLLKKIAQGGFRRVKENFSPEQRAKTIHSFYQELIE